MDKYLFIKNKFFAHINKELNFVHTGKGNNQIKI